MDSDFYVYLPSNVSPDTFPNNNPSCYSTLLANEIDLLGSNWEVGVQNIIYPTHIATTSAADKITIYEPADVVRRIFTHDNTFVSVYLNSKAYKSPAVFKAEKADGKAKNYNAYLAAQIQADFNSVEWVKSKGYYNIEYRDSNNKFIMYNRLPDLLWVPTENLRKHLGFQERCLLKGEYWSWSKFDSSKDKLRFGYDRYSLFDLTLLEQEDITFRKSWDTVNKVHLFTANVTLKFRDFKDDNLLFEPTVQIELNLQRGQMRINVLKATPEHMRRYEVSLLLLKLYDAAPKNVRWYKHANYCLLQDDGRTLLHKNIEGLATLSKEELDKLKDFKAIVYFHTARTIVDTHEKTPLRDVPIKTGKEIKEPTELLTNLNEFGPRYGYKFSYLDNLKRFEVSITGKYYIQISHSLASILGFGSYAEVPARAPVTYRAINFPVLNRAITTLYTYTNIVDVVHIGDTRAALLLSCPFTINKENNVQQLEFLRPTYAKVNRQKLNQIDIEIRDGAGELIPFLHGKTVITLHFRQRH